MELDADVANDDSIAARDPESLDDELLAHVCSNATPR
jgi:hypothetical protein